MISSVASRDVQRSSVSGSDMANRLSDTSRCSVLSSRNHSVCCWTRKESEELVNVFAESLIEVTVLFKRKILRDIALRWVELVEAELS